MAGRIKNISLMNTAEASPVVMFGDVWYEPGGEFGPRMQPDYQLVIMHLGEARVSFDDQSCVIPPGSVALMLPGRQEYFRFSRHHPTHHTWCQVHPSIVPAPLRKRLTRLPALRRRRGCVRPTARTQWIWKRRRWLVWRAAMV